MHWFVLLNVFVLILAKSTLAASWVSKFYFSMAMLFYDDGCYVNFFSIYTIRQVLMLVMIKKNELNSLIVEHFAISFTFHYCSNSPFHC